MCAPICELPSNTRTIFSVESKWQKNFLMIANVGSICVISYTERNCSSKAFAMATWKELIALAQRERSNCWRPSTFKKDPSSCGTEGSLKNLPEDLVGTLSETWKRFVREKTYFLRRGKTTWTAWFLIMFWGDSRHCFGSCLRLRAGSCGRPGACLCSSVRPCRACPCP